MSIIFFGDRINHFSRTNKKGLLKMYGDQQKKIEQWLEENKIDLSKEEDLKKLSVYLQIFKLSVRKFDPWTRTGTIFL